MKLINTAKALLMDASLYLKQIDSADYSRGIDVLSGSSIGQHSRHFIEFFQCLYVQMSAPEKVVNYDKRQRNHQIETNPSFALQVIETLILEMGRHHPDANLQLDACFPEGNVSIPSSYQRELLYNIEHTIHHLAIIKIGLRVVTPQMELPTHFGVAASTIKYRTELCAQ